jgi:hypothetical protein
VTGTAAARLESQNSVILQSARKKGHLKVICFFIRGSFDVRGSSNGP